LSGPDRSRTKRIADMKNNTFDTVRKTVRTVVNRLPVLVVALALTSATSSALADDRHRGNAPRFKPNHTTSFNRDQRHYAGNNRGRSQWNRRWNSNRRYTGNRFYSNTYRNRFYDHDSWAVSLNIGSGYSNWNSSSLFYGTGFATNNWLPRHTRTSVIYNQPTVVYVNDRPATTRVVTTTSTPRTSLLRDLFGDCYERTIDSRGRETRTRLPDSACRF